MSSPLSPLCGAILRARRPPSTRRPGRALSVCVRIDEAADWSDKAMALALYARQAKDDELLRMATRIRARSMCRCGELLRQIEPAKNQHARTAAGTNTVVMKTLCHLWPLGTGL